ncbi:MAG: PD40 domain-containing protein [Pirellulales bacterium]|nr:PD40 domain-containing protein [Pirellulales bacterium]
MPPPQPKSRPLSTSFRVLSTHPAKILLATACLAGHFAICLGSETTGKSAGFDNPWPEFTSEKFSADPCRVISTAQGRAEKSRQRLAILADWLIQDDITAGKSLTTEIVARIVGQLDGKVVDDRVKSLKDRLHKLEEEKTPPGDSRLGSLYLAACEARRLERLGDHKDALRRIVFTKHYDMGGSHYAYTEGQSDAQREKHFVAGTELCLLEMDDEFGKIRTLVADPSGVIRDPDVSPDGRRILFAWKKSLDKDDYHLYEIDIEADSKGGVNPGNVRQITHGLGFADYEGMYLPDGNIIFNSTRCVQTVDCWWTEVSNLFTCSPDGRHIRQLAYDQVHTNYPTLTPDGRVIYTRWDYNDRGQIFPQGLFSMLPDGSGQTEVYGNNSWFPTTIMHARAIPGRDGSATGKIICIFSGHHTRQRGWLGIIEPRHGRQENHGATLIAPLRETPAERIDRYGQTGDQFQYPYPLSETEFLVTFRPEGAKRFGIYFVDIDGHRELLALDAKISCNQPIPLRPRPALSSVPNRVDYRRDDANVYLHDVYHGPGLAGVPRGSIKQLRVVALEFRAAGVGKNINEGPAGRAMASTPISISGAWDVKRILGTAEVHPDGSSCFRVPSRVPVYFQTLDNKGQMVQSMRSWTTFQPGESYSCVGCHEHKNTAPPVSPISMAGGCSPQDLQKGFDDPGRGFSFVREIQPILNRHCVRCHNLDKPPQYGLHDKNKANAKQPQSDTEIRPAFSLQGIQHLEEVSRRKWSISYLALADRGICNWINPQSAPSIQRPYNAGASQSRLIRMFEDESHYGVKLSPRELNRMIVWIDLLVPYVGDYTEAMDERFVEQYNHFLRKREKWRQTEAQNIAELLGTTDK